MIHSHPFEPGPQVSRHTTRVLTGVLSAVLVAGTITRAAQVFTAPQGKVGNIQMERDPARPNVIIITYSLESTDPTALFRVDLVVSLNRGQTYDLKPVSVTGDVGASVRAGSNKRIAWEFEKDTENIQVDRFRFRVTAVAGEVKPVAPPAGGAAPPAKPAPPTEQPGVSRGGSNLKWILPVVGGGAAAAVLLLRKEETPEPPPPCTTFSLSDTSFSFPGGGGSQGVNITGTTPAGCEGGNWVASNGPFFTVAPQAGSGNGSVRVTVDVNNSVLPREGKTTIAGQTLTVSQSPNLFCQYQFIPQTVENPTVTYIFGGGPGSTRGMNITTSNPQCTWTASTDATWLSLSPSSGTGNGTMMLTTTQANTTGIRRRATLTMSGLFPSTPVTFQMCQILLGEAGFPTICT